MAAPFALTTLAQVKTALNVQGKNQDGYLRQLIRTVSAEVASIANRRDMIERRSRTEVYDIEPMQERWALRAQPVQGVTSVIYDPQGNFGSSGSLIDPDSYNVDTRLGHLILNFELTSQFDRHEAQALQVIYDGGIAATIGELRASDFADLEQYAWLIIQATWKRQKTSPQRVSISGQGGSMTIVDLDVPPQVRQGIRRLRRVNVA